MIEKEIVLEVKNLKKYFPAGRRHMLKAVDDVSFTIHKGETFGIVGESGCGKTTCGKTCTGILSKTDGQVLYQGKDVHHMSKAEKSIFTQKIQTIFQDPYASLDPHQKYTILLQKECGYISWYLISRKKKRKLWNFWKW